MGVQEEKEKARLQQAFGDMVDELQLWREEHAQASLDEIAAQVTPRRRALMGEIVAALARQHGSGVVVEGLRCEECGQALEYKGEPVRAVEHYLEGEIALTRAYYYCPQCEAGIFPPG